MVFTFPGQGSYDHKIARELCEAFPYENEFRRADEICNQILGSPLLPLLQSEKEAEQNEILRACPELDQVVIFVTGVLIASALQESGLTPNLLLGHSFGELAALTVAGVCSFDDGLRIVCQRSATLRALGDAGKMAAASCGAERAAELISQAGGKALQISVTNGARQTVISGTLAELEELGALMTRQGIGLTTLKARYPFHSALLQPAIEPFRLVLCAYTFHKANVPVYLCTERRFYSPDTDVPAVLTGHLTKRLDFGDILQELHQKGYRQFVECGAGNIVTKITKESGLEGVVASTTALPGEGVRKGCDRVLEAFGLSRRNRTASHGPSLMQLRDMLRDVNAALGQTSRVLQDVLGQKPTPELAMNHLHVDAASDARSEPVVQDQARPDLKIELEPCEAAPIAIVAMGCMLPGARDAEQYWQNIATGVSGIVDLAQEDPSMARDFLAGKGGSDVSVVSDKTYTLLHGSVGKVQYDGKLLSRFYSETEFSTLTRAEKLLALATAQAIGSAKGDLSSFGENRVECVLGATADGCAEYDDALFPDSLATTLEAIEANPEIRGRFSATLRSIWGEPPENCVRKTQSDSYAAVMRACSARSVRTYIVDAACSSSLYAISLGVKALQDHSRDVMLVGGVFAPGPANNTLFAQFRGLTPTASRPFDSQADGVVFGDGAGILVLRRLSDAMAAGDRVLGVIRAVSISSDGRSPAINVPQAKGQVIAIDKAYKRSHIDRNSIQYVEAHATATPVGDAVEFDALKRAMTRDAALPPIQLGSVKALIGHTGWAAGVASVIKLCKAFENKIIPPQFNYALPNPEISLKESPFVISTAAHPWPENTGSLPRRAGINGFGFGGTNAHLILEEFKPAYHKALCERVPPASPKTDRLAVIAAEMLFPASDGLDNSKPTGERQFRRSVLRLPKGKMLLPDVRDHMDAGQYIALLAAERALEALGERLQEMKDSIGVITGVESKTERGIHANQRIFLDRLKRRFAEFPEQNGPTKDGLTKELRTSMLNKLCAAIQQKVIPSGPYTLPGLMPNVISGRVANMFDLNGPNAVVDMGANSFFQSILVAREFLAHEDCKAILAGSVNALRTKTDDAEAAGLLLLTTEKTAHDLKLPILGVLSVRESAAPVATEGKQAVSYRAAQGSLELLQAITDHKDCRFFEPQRTGGHGVMLEFQSTPPVGAPKIEVKSKEGSTASSIYSYVQGTPIYFCTPVQVRSEIPAHSQASGTPLRSRNVLFLVDQPEQWKEVERSGALQGTNYHVLCTRAAGLSKSTQVDVTTDQAIEKDLARLAGTFDAIVAAKFLEPVSPDALLTAPIERELQLLDLLFSVCRHDYEQIRSQKVSVLSVCIGAFTKGKVHPITGLFAGFLKSLGRELPDSTCRSINVAETDFSRILPLIEAELTSRNQPVEVAYRDGIRFVTQLSRVERVAQDEEPFLTADSVVLATGGGRGVTAVLAEELQTRFGCTVIAVGRTDTASLPPEILRMTPEELDQYEQEFYKTALQKSKGKKITQLRDQFRAYQSAHEVHGIAQRLSRLPGRFEYISADLTDRDSTTRLVDSCIERYGRIDLVVHGAGIQISKVLSKKTLSEFRNVVRAKLASLEHVYAACQKHRQGRPTHYHILTSAFSYMGNDGQPDYGAANEALNRIADVMNGDASEDSGAHSRWCSVGWLGWAGIGMTRGSEFAALAANRSLRGITKPEGQEIFSKLLVGRPTAAINILMADGEIKFYGVALTKEPFSAPTPRTAVPVRRRDSMTSEHAVSAESVPYILNHLVDGIPTLPGAYLIMLVAQAAMELRPGLQITAFEDASFRRFVRLRSHGPTTLRLNSKVVSEDANSTFIHTAVLSDFTHKSGVVLQKDVIQTEIFVRMASSTDRPNTSKRSTRTGGRLLSDPYVMEGSPVHLNGPFRTLNNIVVGESDRSADFSSKEQAHKSTGSDAFLPNLLIMDSLWRFGAIDMDKRNSLPVYVPEACRIMRVYYNLAEPRDRTLNGSLTLSGSNPVENEDKLVIGPVEVRDATGSVLLTVEGGVCRKLGEVRNAH